MELDGFVENSNLIDDDKGLLEFGSPAYFVNRKWLEEIVELNTKWYAKQDTRTDKKGDWILGLRIQLAGIGTQATADNQGEKGFQGGTTPLS